MSASGARLPAANVRWQSFIAFEGQRVFTVTESVGCFVLVLYGDQALFEVRGGYSVEGNAVRLAGPAWDGVLVVVGYRRP